MAKPLEVCVYYFVSRKDETKKLNNMEMEYCRCYCTGQDKNCSKYLRGEYKQWEYDYAKNN